MNTLQIIRDFISTRRTNYIKTFLNPPGEEVLKDLARFCKANESCFQADPRAHAVAEGRREVWLRIQKNLQLTDEQLWALYTPVNLQSTRSNDNG
jgi:hypothetical protein